MVSEIILAAQRQEEKGVKVGLALLEMQILGPNPRPPELESACYQGPCVT